MTPKYYLQQAFYLDQLINSKLEQVHHLKALACKATTLLSDMPKSKGSASSRVEDIIVKMMELQEEINQDIDDFVDLKQEIMQAIKKIETFDHRIVLEKRYLGFKKWEEIAVEMNYSIQHVYRLHGQGLQKIQQFLKDESK